MVFLVSWQERGKYDLAQLGRKKKVEDIYSNIQNSGGAPMLDMCISSYANVLDRAAASTNFQPIVINYTKKTFLELIMIYIDRKWVIHMGWKMDELEWVVTS